MDQSKQWPVLTFPFEVQTLEERAFTFFNGHNRLPSVYLWPGDEISLLWTYTLEVIKYWGGGAGNKATKNKCTQIIRVTGKLNSAGSVDDKFLIVRRQVCNTVASRVHLKGNFFQPLKRGGRGDPDHTLFMNKFTPFTMGYYTFDF